MTEEYQQDEHYQDPDEWRLHDSAFPDLTIQTGEDQMEKKKLWQFLFWLCLCTFAGASLALIRRLLS